MFDLARQHLFHHGQLLFVDFLSFFGSRIAFYDFNDTSQLLGAHHSEFVIGPREEETRVVCASHHGVISRTITAANHQGDSRHSAIGNRINEFCTRFDDAAFFGRV